MMENPIEMDDLGVPPFRKHPYVITSYEPLTKKRGPRFEAKPVFVVDNFRHALFKI